MTVHHPRLEPNTGMPAAWAGRTLLSPADEEELYSSRALHTFAACCRMLQRYNTQTEVVRHLPGMKSCFVLRETQKGHD